MEFDTNDSTCSSSGSSSVIESADTQGTQPYLFEPYDSEASSDSLNESDEADVSDFSELQFSSLGEIFSFVTSQSEVIVRFEKCSSFWPKNVGLQLE